MDGAELQEASEVVNLVHKLLPSLATSIINHIDTQNNGSNSFQISLDDFDTSYFDFIETNDTLGPVYVHVQNINASQFTWKHVILVAILCATAIALAYLNSDLPQGEFYLAIFRQVVWILTHLQAHYQPPPVPQLPQTPSACPLYASE